LHTLQVSVSWWPRRTGTTVVIVHDAWLHVGSSAPSRRGLTSDGSLDVALFDRQLDDGFSSGIRALRRSLLGRIMARTGAIRRCSLRLASIC